MIRVRMDNAPVCSWWPFDSLITLGRRSSTNRASALAHELGHAMSGHFGAWTPRERIAHELDAWLYASRQGWNIDFKDVKLCLDSYAQAYPQEFIKEVKARGWDK